MPTIDQFMAASDVPVVMADQRGVITFVNDLFLDTFLWEREDLIGQALLVLIPETLRDAHQMGFSRFYVSGEGTILNQQLALEIVTGDGRTVSAEHFIIAEERAGEWVMGASVRPL